MDRYGDEGFDDFEFSFEKPEVDSTREEGLDFDYSFVSEEEVENEEATVKMDAILKQLVNDLNSSPATGVLISDLGSALYDGIHYLEDDDFSTDRELPEDVLQIIKDATFTVRGLSEEYPDVGLGDTSTDEAIVDAFEQLLVREGDAEEFDASDDDEEIVDLSDFEIPDAWNDRDPDEYEEAKMHPEKPFRTRTSVPSKSNRPIGRTIDLSGTSNIPKEYTLVYGDEGIVKSIVIPGKGAFDIVYDEDGEPIGLERRKRESAERIKEQARVQHYLRSQLIEEIAQPEQWKQHFDAFIEYYIKNENLSLEDESEFHHVFGFWLDNVQGALKREAKWQQEVNAYTLEKYDIDVSGLFEQDPFEGEDDLSDIDQELNDYEDAVTKHLDALEKEIQQFYTQHDQQNPPAESVTQEIDGLLRRKYD